MLTNLIFSIYQSQYLIKAVYNIVQRFQSSPRNQASNHHHHLWVTFKLFSILISVFIIPTTRPCPAVDMSALLTSSTADPREHRTPLETGKWSSIFLIPRTYHHQVIIPVLLGAAVNMKNIHRRQGQLEDYKRTGWDLSSGASDWSKSQINSMIGLKVKIDQFWPAYNRTVWQETTAGH